MNSLKKMIRKYREKAGLTPKQVAQKTNLSLNYYRLIESSSPTHISENVIKKLGKALNCPRRAMLRNQNQNNQQTRTYNRKYLKKRLS